MTQPTLTAAELPTSAIVATEDRVWIKRSTLVGTAHEEQFWLEASGGGTARMGNARIQPLLDSGEARVLRAGAVATAVAPPTPSKGRYAVRYVVVDTFGEVRWKGEAKLTATSRPAAAEQVAVWNASVAQSIRSSCDAISPPVPAGQVVILDVQPT